ncbi:MAG: polar amino acid ABC transporter ATP-binding protein [Anaerolineaceae bacterium]|nr:polar amino acid ABC transporter ATP-binding protein [Anaerolineaceae bacterium]
MTEKMLIAENLTKSFGSRTVIDKLSFSLKQTERLAIIARSGAGKTTLLRIFAGLEQPDHGSAKIATNSTAFLFQEARLFPFLTVEENILLPYKAQKRSFQVEDQKALQTWLKVGGLLPFTRYYPYQLSGGMKKKTALIRALLGKPELIFMDEPFHSIDRQSVQNIVQFMSSFNANATLLLVSHNMEEINQMADTVLVFEKDNLSHPQLKNNYLKTFS